MKPDFDYSVVRSDRKTAAIQVKSDGTVVVRVPKRMPQADIERFFSNHIDWVEKHRRIAVERTAALPPEPDADRIQAYIDRAHAYLPGRIAYYSGIMGVKPEAITVTGARTRFGSCSGKNRICFSWRLMCYPDEAIDYVVVHELAHIKHHNHSPAFYRFIESVMPDHAERRKLLRKPPVF